MMRTLSVDTYGLTWVQFTKGVAVGAFTAWLVLR